MSYSLRHSGDLGDIIFGLALLRSLDRRASVFLVDRNKSSPFTAPLVSRADFLIPLLEAQDYIAEVRCTEEEPTVDISPFRMFHSHTTTLVAAQVAYFNQQTNSRILETGERPWLSVASKVEQSDRIIISRSPRYNNRAFRWKRIVNHYGPRLWFVGLQHEHEAFCNEYGLVEYLPVRDFLQLAEILKGAALFIGNQSSPHAVALGLGVPIISEVCAEQPDCVYRRHNVQYVIDGACVLPDISGSGKLTIEPVSPVLPAINRAIIPPGLWQYPELPPTTHFDLLVPLVMQLEPCDKDEALAKITLHNIKRCEDFFKFANPNNTELFDLAYRQAFGSPFPRNIPVTTTTL